MRRTPLHETLAITKALSDRQRVRILMLLTRGELCVCQIVEVMGLAASTVSKHLSLLSAAGLADGRKEGRWAYYRTSTKEPILRWLVQALRTDPQIQLDQNKLNLVKKKNMEDLCRQQRAN